MALAGDEVFVEVCRTINEIKEGLRPACLTQVRICEPGAPLQLCGERTVASMVVAAYFVPLAGTGGKESA